MGGIWWWVGGRLAGLFVGRCGWNVMSGSIAGVAFGVGRMLADEVLRILCLLELAAATQTTIAVGLFLIATLSSADYYSFEDVCRR